MQTIDFLFPRHIVGAQLASLFPRPHLVVRRNPHKQTTRGEEPSQQLALSPTPKLPASRHPQSPGPAVPNPPQSDTEHMLCPSAHCREGPAGHTGQRNPSPQSQPDVNSRLDLVLFSGSKRGGGTLSPEFSPTFCSRRETQPTPHTKPGKPGLLIEPVCSCHRGSERARGLPKVTQQSDPDPRPDAQLSARRPHCFLHGLLVLQSQPHSGDLL